MVKVKFLLKVIPIFAAFAIVLAHCEKNHPPNIPSNPSPANGATNQPTSLTLSWTGGDPDGDTVTYTLFFGTSANPPKKDSGLTSPSLPIADIIKDTTYYWKVRAEDVRGSVSEGPVWSFKTVINHPPNIPSNPSPANGATNQPTSLTLSWTGGDPDGDTVTYTLFFGTSSNPPEKDSDFTAASYSISSLSKDTTYFWKVRAEDKYGSLVDGPVWNFKTSLNRPPNTPSIPSGPSNGSVRTFYSFSSSATDPDSDNTVIIFDWGDGTTSGWSSFVTSGKPVTMSHAWPSVGTYYVKAKAADTKGVKSDWSSPKAITIFGGEGSLKWSYLTGSSIWSSPAIGSDGTIYVGSDDSCLYAINPNGTLKWRYQTGDSVDSSPAIGLDGTIYVGSDDHYLYAINTDGTLKWRYLTGYGVESSPAIGSDGTIYVGSKDEYLYAINSDGSLKWQCWISQQVNSSPAIGSDGTIYVGSDEWCFFAIGSDGKIIWEFDTGAYGVVRSSPALGLDGTIYVGSEDYNFYALNPYCTLKWRYLTSGSVVSSPAIGLDGTVYVGSEDRLFYAFNPNGTRKWSLSTGSYVNSSPAIGSDGTVYVASDDGYFYAISPKGSVKWRFQTVRAMYSSPAIGSDGTVYVGSEDNHIYAIQGSGTLASTPWPMFHHDLKHSGNVGGP